MRHDDRRARPPLPWGFGRIVEPIYRMAVAQRNRRFDRGIDVVRASIPVICIGNLSVGGTGKTPCVMWTIEQLRQLGARPGIAMRGYKAAAGMMSDEQAEYAERFPDVPVVADADRHAAVHALAQQHGVDVVVLDDGFQHRRLARDLDVVLLDATRPVFADRCLPAGWLREPVSSLKRAGALVWTHAEATDSTTLAKLVARTRSLVGPHVPIACAAHAWTALECSDGGERSPDWLRGKQVAMACGIGNPTAFQTAIEAAGATITRAVVRPDHHHWSARDVSVLVSACRGCDALITTGKDWVKLQRVDGLSRVGCPVIRPRIAIDMIDGREALIERLRMVIARRGAAVSP